MEFFKETLELGSKLRRASACHTAWGPDSGPQHPHQSPGWQPGTGIGRWLEFIGQPALLN